MLKPLAECSEIEQPGARVAMRGVRSRQGSPAEWAALMGCDAGNDEGVCLETHEAHDAVAASVKHARR